MNVLLFGWYQRKLITSFLIIQLIVTMAVGTNTVLLSKQALDYAHQDTGFSLEDGFVFEIMPTTDAYRYQPGLGELVESQIQELGQLRQVESVTYSGQAPLQSVGLRADIYIEGERESSEVSAVPYTIIDHNLPAVLDFSVAEGRWFNSEDKNTKSIVVTRSLAESLLKERSAIGALTNWGRIIGVVSDVYFARKGSHPYHSFYIFADLPNAERGYALLLKKQKSIENKAFISLVSWKLNEINTAIHIREASRFEQRFSNLYMTERGLADIMLVLTTVMLLVSCASAYGHALFQGIRGRRETGIRRALGASRQRIMLGIMGESCVIGLLGVLLGVMFSFIFWLMLKETLNMPPFQLWLAVLIGIFVLLCHLLATLYPALEAMKITPVEATRVT